MHTHSKAFTASTWVVACCASAIAIAANTGVKFADAINAGNINIPGLSEVSGCAASHVNEGIFWMHNDGSHAPGFYAVSKTGLNKGFFTHWGASDMDAEDIAVGPGPVAGQSYIYLGDIGDHGASRTSTHVYRMVEPKIGTTSPTLTAERFTFKYPGGARDAETLMVDPRNGDVYVVGKRETAEEGNPVYRFAAPLSHGGTYTGEEVARIHQQWLVGGDISFDGSRILIKTLDQTFLWLRKDGESVGSALSRKPVAVPTANEPQGEAICWDAQGVDYYTTSVGSNQPLHHFKNTDRAGATDAPTNTNSLKVGAQLNAGQMIQSTNSSYRLYLQDDGNLVLRNSSGQAIWATATNGQGGTRLALQNDGNLVLYTVGDKAVWACGTAGQGTGHLILRNDGNLVLVNASGAVVWATNTGDGTGPITPLPPSTLAATLKKP